MNSIACRCTQPIFSGSGLSDIRLHKSFPRLQYGGNIRLVEGRNLGGAFTRFFRYIAPIVQKALPYIKSSAKAAGKEVLQGGLEILENIDEKPLKSLMKEQTKKRVKNLSERAAQTLKKNLTEGSGKRRKKRKQKKIVDGKGLKNKKKSNKRRKMQTEKLIRGVVVRKRKPVKKQKTPIKKNKTNKKKSQKKSNTLKYFE